MLEEALQDGGGSIVGLSVSESMVGADVDARGLPLVWLLPAFLSFRLRFRRYTCVSVVTPASKAEGGTQSDVLQRTAAWGV